MCPNQARFIAWAVMPMTAAASLCPIGQAPMRLCWHGTSKLEHFANDFCKCEAAIPGRPAKSERKNSAFFALVQQGGETASRMVQKLENFELNMLYDKREAAAEIVKEDKGTILAVTVCLE